MPAEIPEEIEICPMASFPTLVVSEMQPSAAWYCEAFGFTNVLNMPVPEGKPTLMHLRWVKYAERPLFPNRWLAGGPVAWP